MNGRNGAYYEELIAAGGHHVAATGEVLLGNVEASNGVILHLVLRPDVAGQGLGRRLLGRGIEVAGATQAGI